MKVWRVRIQDSQFGNRLFWHPNRRSARSSLRELRRIYDVISEDVESVEVPTDKGGLLRWLNRNALSDNDPV